MAEPRPPHDDRTAASVATAWIVLFNKPVYPLYVWWLIGAQAVAASTLTMLSAPLYAAIPFLARRSPFAARLLLPAAGVADTLLATKLFGAAGGTELFLFPCVFLATVAFSTRERAASRGLIAAIFVVFVALHGRFGAPLHEGSAQDAARLFDLNAFAVASLCAFIGLRFGGASDRETAR